MTLRFVVVQGDKSVDSWVNLLFERFKGHIPIREFRESLQERFQDKPYMVLKEDSPFLQKHRKELDLSLYQLENGFVHQFPPNPYDRLNEILDKLGPRRYRQAVKDQLPDLFSREYSGLPKFEPYLDITNVCMN